jgi:inosose dehydratase
MFASLSRRRFLALSAAASAGATWFDAPRLVQAAGLADTKDPWGGFPVGVQTYSLRNYSIEEAARHLEGMGVRHAELYSKHLDPKGTPEQDAAVKRLLEAAGIRISAHGVNNFSPDHEANRMLFKFAKRIGFKTITSNFKTEPATLESLDKLVAEYDVRIAIHNHGPGSHFDKLESVTSAIAGHDKRIGACVDCGHYISSGEDPVKCVLTLKDRVYGVHLKDHVEYGKKSANAILGKGHLDVVGLFRALREIKFPADGALSLEYEANPMNPIDDMKTCLEIAKEAISKSA